MKRLEGKTALVTGGASGLGRAICLRFAEEGANVVAADLDGVGAEATAREAGGCAAATQADVRSKAECEAMVRATIERFGRIDIFVANAGVARSGTVLNMLEQDWDDLMAVNLKGVFVSCQAAAVQMVAKGGPGKIILMSSLASERAAPGMLAYAASKAAVRQMARVMALELMPYHINVNAIGPGVVDTTPLARPLADLIKATGSPGSPWGRFASEQDVASVALFLASDESDFITGSIQFVDGGVLAGQAGPAVVMN
jgi:NAD(P)-dependent dehydrogenase (short-subunit alcohol dehydrogenase family)